MVDEQPVARSVHAIRRPVAAGDLAGTSVSGAGDVNGDGFLDVMVGAPLFNGASGQAYVLFGDTTVDLASGLSSGARSLSTLIGTIGVKLDGTVPGVSGATEVFDAGDLNVDGYDDMSTYD